MMTEPVLTYNRHPSPSSAKLPAGATDAHVHIFGPSARFPYAAQTHLVPEDAPKETLFELHRSQGIERCVIVQSLVHGHDNRVVEDAISASAGRYLGVALVDINVGHEELKRLSEVGFRGVRFHLMPGLTRGETPEEIVAFTHRLAPLGMHLQLQLHAMYAKTLMPVLQRSAVTVVLDHMGRVDASLGVQQEHFQDFCRLLDQPGFMVKISGIDRIDAHPPYVNGIEFARYLVERFPDQCVWGSDWPHPNHTHIPDDGMLVDALLKIAPKPDFLHRVLVDNPQRLYRFPA